MTYDEFFASVTKGEIAPVYLFQGEEEYVKEKALQALEKKLLPDGLEPLNETVLQNPAATTIVEAALTLPLLASMRLVVVNDLGLLYAAKAGENAAEVVILSDYLSNPMPSTCVVFYCRAMPDARRKMLKLLRQYAITVQFDRLSDAKLIKWIQNQLRPKSISDENAALLFFTVGRELMALSGEIAKLLAFVGERNEITGEDIAKIVTPSLESTVFQMVDALTDGREGDAFRILAAMLENGESRIGILAVITRQYRNLLQLSLLLEKKLPEVEIARFVGVPPFVVRKLRRKALEEGTDRLKEKLALCVDTDYAIKCGKMRDDAALDRAMLLLCERTG